MCLCLRVCTFSDYLLFPNPSPPHYFERFRVVKCHSSLSPTTLKSCLPATARAHTHTHFFSLLLLTLFRVRRMHLNKDLVLTLSFIHTHTNIKPETRFDISSKIHSYTVKHMQTHISIFPLLVCATSVFLTARLVKKE